MTPYCHQLVKRKPWKDPGLQSLTETKFSRPGGKPSPCQGSSLLSEGMGFCYCCWVVLFLFLQLTYHVQRHAIQKFSLMLKLIMLFFFTIIKHVSAETQLKSPLREVWVNLPNADHSALPHLSPKRLFLWLPSLPFSTSMHPHQVDLHLLINDFKMLQCHFRGYVSHLPL